MHIAYVIAWEESEAGWGTRPDGLSLHLDANHAAEFIRNHWASQKPGPAPAEYERPVSEKGEFVEVPAAVYEKVVAAGGSLRSYSYSVTVTRTGARRLVDKNGFLGETFMDKVAAKTAKLDEFDDYVAKWHAGEAEGAQLHVYLGLSTAEYGEVVKSPGALARIALARALGGLQASGFTHVKSQGEYLVLGEGKLERDGTPAIVYLGVDGVLWVRDAAEFRDGRFQANPNVPATKLTLAG